MEINIGQHAHTEIDAILAGCFYRLVSLTLHQRQNFLYRKNFCPETEIQLMTPKQNPLYKASLLFPDHIREKQMAGRRIPARQREGEMEGQRTARSAGGESMSRRRATEERRGSRCVEHNRPCGDSFLASSDQAPHSSRCAHQRMSSGPTVHSTALISRRRARLGKHK